MKGKTKMSKGEYRLVKGDVTNPIGDGVKVIPHIISDLGVCGAGVAKAIVKKWPNILLDIQKIKKDTNWWKLGFIVRSDVEDDIIVLSMVAQEGLRGKDNPRPIKYVALVDCMKNVLSFVYPNSDYSIHCPKFGAGLAGGNWDFIEALIKEIWVDNQINVTVYEYGERK